MINWELFYEKYNIDKEKVKATYLTEELLNDIYCDYKGKLDYLENAALMVSENLRKCDSIHSIKYRTKDPEHLIEKITRKVIENNDRIINLDNYLDQITDLIGLRVIHLFKYDWIHIHKFILDRWNMYENPKVYIRKGDSKEIVEEFEKYECEIEEHKFGYRSIHYLIEFQPQKDKIIAEIQVRTIFEEGWSEIDHKLRYPYWNDNVIITNYLEIFNRLAGSADEMGTFITQLDIALKEMKENVFKANLEKDATLKELENTINKLEMESNERSKLLKKVKTLEENLNNKGVINISDSSINTILKQYNNQLSGSFKLGDFQNISYETTSNPFDVSNKRVEEYLKKVIKK